MQKTVEKRTHPTAGNRQRRRYTARDRTAKDYAIEFGGYLADAARNFQVALNSGDPTERDEKWKALSSAIYEFEKRRDKAVARQQETPDAL